MLVLGLRVGWLSQPGGRGRCWLELPPTANWWADCGRNGEERGVLCLDDANRTRPMIKKDHEKARKAYRAKKKQDGGGGGRKCMCGVVYTARSLCPDQAQGSSRDAAPRGQQGQKLRPMGLAADHAFDQPYISPYPFCPSSSLYSQMVSLLSLVVMVLRVPG